MPTPERSRDLYERPPVDIEEIKRRKLEELRQGKGGKENLDQVLKPKEAEALLTQLDENTETERELSPQESMKQLEQMITDMGPVVDKISRLGGLPADQKIEALQKIDEVLKTAKSEDGATTKLINKITSQREYILDSRTLS